MDNLHTKTDCRQFVKRANTRFAPTVFLLFCSLLLAPCFLVYASDAEEALAAMQRRYASVETISGSFRLTYSDFGIEQVESGEFWLKKPAFMRWEYRHPEEKLFIADGRETFFYEPLDRHVTVQSFTAEELLSTPLTFLLGSKDIGESFVIEPEYDLDPESEGTQIVRLIPKSEMEYTFLVLEIDEASSDLRRLVIRELAGNTLEYLFTDLETNAKVSDKKFSFEFPDDVEVHRLENYE
jgi:outer membrane lipoprotein carrier protein